MAATSESCCKLRNGVGEDIPHLSNIEQKNSFSEQPMKQRVNVEHSLDHWGLSKKAPNMLAQERLHWTLTAYLTNSRWIGVRVQCSLLKTDLWLLGTIVSKHSDKLSLRCTIADQRLLTEVRVDCSVFLTMVSSKRFCSECCFFFSSFCWFFHD